MFYILCWMYHPFVRTLVRCQHRKPVETSYCHLRTHGNNTKGRGIKGASAKTGSKQQV